MPSVAHALRSRSATSPLHPPTFCVSPTPDGGLGGGGSCAAVPGAQLPADAQALADLSTMASVAMQCEPLEVLPELMAPSWAGS